jgi:hypothetical protein
MPDLKSEMSKVLEAWEQDVEQLQQEKQMQKKLPQQFVPTNNVTQETFNYVKNNPNKTSGEIRSVLVARGFNAGSIGSLLTQFTKQNQMVKDPNGRYTVCVPSYTPLKSTRQFRAAGKRINKIVNIKSKPKSAGIAALQVDTTTQKPFSVGTPKVITQWDADTIINNIGLKQARALYDELKKIFGG